MGRRRHVSGGPASPATENTSSGPRRRKTGSTTAPLVPRRLVGRRACSHEQRCVRGVVSQRRSRAQSARCRSLAARRARVKTDASKWSATGTARVLPVILRSRTSALLVLTAFALPSVLLNAREASKQSLQAFWRTRALLALSCHGHRCSIRARRRRAKTSTHGQPTGR